MRVLITGGTGRIGQVVCQRLLAKGWQLRVLDNQEQTNLAPGIDYVQADITDFKALKTAMQDCDAVVHLAAIAAPTNSRGERLFEVNVAGTFNVYEAAAQAGIKRVVQASSINAKGCFWSIDDVPAQYFPIDEAHPRFTVDPYSLSKQLAEDIAEYFYRRDGISGTSLRFPGVYQREQLTGAFLKRKAQLKSDIAELLLMDETLRQQRIANLMEDVLAFRRLRPLEQPQFQELRPFERRHEDSLWSMLMFDRFDFWAMLDSRDAAQSLEKSLSADYQGSHVLFICETQNSLAVDSALLARLFFPQVQIFSKPLIACESFFSIDKARALIGFEPEYSFSQCQEGASS